MKTKNKIQFGILTELNRYNKHRSQELDLVSKHMQEIDIHSYLKPFSRVGLSYVEDMINGEVAGFKDYAHWIKALDDRKLDSSSQFYLVCYLTDKNGNPTGFEKIKHLFY